MEGLFEFLDIGERRGKKTCVPTPVDPWQVQKYGDLVESTVNYGRGEVIVVENGRVFPRCLLELADLSTSSTLILAQSITIKVTLSF